MSILHNPKLTKRAQELRRQATKQENHLWYDFLRTYPVQFRRQITIKRFIVDFFCAKANLIIEIDGSQHFSDDGKDYDALRTEVLNSLGYTVLRFTNYEVDYQFDSVCEMIDQVVRKRVE